MANWYVRLCRRISFRFWSRNGEMAYMGLMGWWAGPRMSNTIYQGTFGTYKDVFTAFWLCTNCINGRINKDRDGGWLLFGRIETYYLNNEPSYVAAAAFFLSRLIIILGRYSSFSMPLVSTNYKHMLLLCCIVVAIVAYVADSPVCLLTSSKLCLHTRLWWNYK